MKGLLIKEYYISRYMVLMFLIIICAMAAGFSNTTSDQETLESFPYYSFILIFISSVYTSILPVFTFQHDEKCNWANFILALGVTRKTIFNSKLLYVLITSLIFSIPLIVIFTIDYHSDPLLLVYGILLYFVINYLTYSLSFLVIVYLDAMKASVISTLCNTLLAGIFIGAFFLVLLVPSLTVNFAYFGAAILLLGIIIGSVLLYLGYRKHMRRDY